MFKDILIEYLQDIAAIECGDAIKNISIIDNDWNLTFINILNSGLFTIQNMLYTLAVFHRSRFDYENVQQMNFNMLMHNIIMYFSEYPYHDPGQFVRENLAIPYHPINVEVNLYSYESVITNNLLNFSNILLYIMIIYKCNPSIDVEDALIQIIDHYDVVRGELTLYNDNNSDNMSNGSDE